MSCQTFDQCIQRSTLDLTLDIICKVIFQIMFQEPDRILCRRNRRWFLNNGRGRSIVSENPLYLGSRITSLCLGPRTEILTSKATSTKSKGIKPARRTSRHETRWRRILSTRSFLTTDFIFLDHEG